MRRRQVGGGVASLQARRRPTAEQRGTGQQQAEDLHLSGDDGEQRARGADGVGDTEPDPPAMCHGQRRRRHGQQRRTQHLGTLHQPGEVFAAEQLGDDDGTDRDGGRDSEPAGDLAGDQGAHGALLDGVERRVGGRRGVCHDW